MSGWYEYGFRWYDAGIGRFTGVDPIADEFAWVSVFNYAENEPVGHIDLHGLQAYNVIGQDGRKRLSGNYKTSSRHIRASIDAISASEKASISDITFRDIGPSEYSTTTAWGGKRSLFHEMKFDYCGVDECGNAVEGSGNILVPAGEYKTGSSAGDVALGGLFAYGRRLFGGMKVGSVQRGANLADECVVVSAAKTSTSGGEFLFNTWHKGTFANRTQSVMYHVGNHGKGRTAVQYTQDAMNFFNKNKELGQNVILKDGTQGIKIQIKQIINGKTQRVGGYWTNNGKLVTFWD